MIHRVVSVEKLNRTFNTVREELREVGLLEEGRYLDRIRCYRAWLPTLKGFSGYVYDETVPWLNRIVGFVPGDIYIPLNAQVRPSTPGETLLDTVRHEFGHSWAWLDREHIDGRWFRRAFGACYGDEWESEPDFDRSEFVSAYACTRPAEDFCETLMTFLRCRRSLHRFDRRPGLKRKLSAVAGAVSIAARTRVPSVRGPRRR